MNKQRTVRLLAAALMLVSVAGFTALPASAQEGAPACEITPSYEGTIVVGVVGGTVVNGAETITLEGSGFPPNCELQIIVDGVVVGVVVTDGSGNFSTGVALGSAISGTVNVGVQAGSFVRTVALTVAGTPTTTAAPTTIAIATVTPQTTGTLPVTGSDSSLLLSAGVLLVVMGGLIVVGARRRNAA